MLQRIWRGREAMLDQANDVRLGGFTVGEGRGSA